MVLLLLLWTILTSMATLAFGRRDDHVAAGLDKLLTDHSSLKTEHISQLWQTFKSSFKKVYDRADEELERFAHFERNARLIHGHNADPSRNFKLGFNSYSDMSPHQMRLSLNGLRYSKKTRYDSRLKFRRSSFVADLNNGKTGLDESIDYRSKGVVTPVKDQGNCGSCYSFSATGALEGAFALAGHGLRNLSEQQILDCSGAWGNNGCNGGLMDFCFQYVIDNRGIDSEESYPYETIEDLCRFNRSNVAASCVEFVDILPEGNEEALLQALKQHGPISIGIDASPTSFMFYRSGVYSDRDCSSESLDHGVLLVGAGVEKSVDKNGSEVLEPYWLVKNSWGTSWGDHGYIKLARNMNNMCGVATAASYPIVKK